MLQTWNYVKRRVGGSGAGSYPAGGWAFNNLTPDIGTAFTQGIGDTAFYNFNVDRLDYPGDIAYSITGLPAGVTITSNSPSGRLETGNSEKEFSLVYDGSTATGSYSFTVTATGGGISHTTTITFQIIAA